MNISVASKNQLPIVRDLALRIWPVTYGEILSAAQLEYMLDMMYSIPSLEEQLETRPFLLVEDEGQVIGFASYELNIDGSNSTKIHKIYVLPEIQGKGIGRKLIDYIAEITVSHHNTSLQLTVNKYNKAKDFYEKLGFVVTEEKVFDIGNGYVMDDYVMEKPLSRLI